MKLNEFLVKAKVNTYASSGEGRERTLNDGTKELTYEEGQFKYRDRYFGFNPFIGEEVVFENNKVVWGMNYYGFITSNKVSAKEVYEFLKKALRKVKSDKSCRGPPKLKDRNFEYINKVDGNIEKFAGVEKIFYKKKEVYRLYYHGGSVKTKL